MNDKNQLAAMGEHLAEQQPLCMAKRIEELEAQVRVMVGLLREAQECVVHDVVRGMGRDVESLWARIDAALAGKMPSNTEQPLAMVPEGWQLVPVVPTESMIGHGCGASVMVVSEVIKAWAAMLAASPKPECWCHTCRPVTSDDMRMVLCPDCGNKRCRAPMTIATPAPAAMSLVRKEVRTQPRPSRSPPNDLLRSPCQRRGAIPATAGSLCRCPAAGAVGGHPAQRSEAKADRTPHHYRAGARIRGVQVTVSVCWDHQADQGGAVTQQNIDQEIYRQRLIDYVKANSNKSEQQAIDYLDQNCPAWRQGVAPAAGVVEVAETGDQEE